MENSDIYERITSELQSLAGTENDIRILSNFFKTKKGEYGEGDCFLGIRVPEQRKVAKKFFRICSFQDIEKLLKSSFHEYRLTGLFLLVYLFEVSDEEKRKKIYQFYRKHIRFVNNWDLVDTTAPYILGEYMSTYPEEKNRLYVWAQSKNLWERRVAILSTFAFIKKNSFSDTIVIAEKLLVDKHDLIHKAVGWMLREVGKRDKEILIHFLEKYTNAMPRTMLRYAIEKFPQEERGRYLKRKSLI
ncbi:MAG: DNA alkylation repair protein [Candidatus Moraniibacteriota bacterium]|nr:MAG: DNA alkylation repair protein [Candidatus Moranbacteria bacterium]